MGLMKHPGAGIWLDLGKGSCGTLALFLVYLSVPVAGLLPGIFVPLPAMFYAVKHGSKLGAGIVLISAAALAVVVDPGSSLIYLFQDGLLSLLLPPLLGSGKGVSRALMLAVTATFVAILLAAIVYGVTTGIDLQTQLVKGIEKSVSQTIALYQQSGVTGDDLATLRQAMQQGGALIARIFPAMALVSLAGIAGLNVFAVNRLRTRLPNLPEFGDFRQFKNPDLLVWILIAAGFALLVPSEAVHRVALNILVVTLFAYLLQGMAIVQYLLGRFVVPAAMRFLLYFFLVLQPYLLIGVAVLGVFDLWGNFRTPRRPENL
ncbi:uncharacterized protein YybS (DUF2232 family) [Geobacter argillaceus]|uniref:Uncharacterized protein YybS (DUF2232 family) n=2 Tax=Geobacter argillaceus TaxID=345631 RepID=A0A562VF63_9BACT|nr:uncharacterized protein YybS (DUF2232 family) [Geobacter argillaceus]